MGIVLVNLSENAEKYIQEWAKENGVGSSDAVSQIIESIVHEVVGE